MITSLVLGIAGLVLAFYILGIATKVAAHSGKQLQEGFKSLSTLVKGFFNEIKKQFRLIKG